MSTPLTSNVPVVPSFFRSAVRVYELSLGRMLWSRRTLFMALVVGGPVVVALVLRLLAALDLLSLTGGVDFVDSANQRVTIDGPGIFGLMVWGFYLRFSVPLLGVFYGTSLIADEVEDKTITYLFTRPLSRCAVLAGKYFAYLVSTGLVLLPSVMLVFFLVVSLLGGSIGAAFPSLVTDLALLAVGLAVYGALFMLIGTWFKRPLLTGLVFILGWEPIVAVVPGYLKRFTVSYYLEGLAPHALPQDRAVTGILGVMQVNEVVPSVAASLIGLGLILVGGLSLSAWVVERREYVIEQ